MTILKFCKKYLLSHKWLLISHIALTTLAAFAGIASPYITGRFIDSLIYGTGMEAIIRFCLIFGAINISSIIVNYVASQIYIRLHTSVVFALNREVAEHVQNLSISYISKQDTAYLTQRVDNDSRELMVFCISFLRDSIINILLLVVPLAILASLNWIIGLALLIFLMAYFALYFVFRNPIYKVDFIYKEKHSAFFASLYEQFSLVKKIKLDSIQDLILGRLGKAFVEARDSAIKRQKWAYLFAGSDRIVLTVAQIALFVTGGIQIFYGNFTVGMFTMFFSYFNMILSSSRYFYNISATYQKTLVAHTRIVQLLNEKQESRGNKVIDDIEKISLHDVCFGYGVDNVIENLTAELSRGGIYGVVGQNGSGKSSIINLIMGMYIEEREGVIAYNDIDIRELDMVAARKSLMSFAEQEPGLISDTIRYNLTFGYDELDYDKFTRYSKILNMEEFFDVNTVDFMLSEKNSNTSGGEKQKISILKVLYKDAPVMIFDEPTSALDLASTERLIDYLEQIKKDKIIIIVTHDERIINKCTSLLRIDSK